MPPTDASSSALAPEIPSSSKDFTDSSNLSCSRTSLLLCHYEEMLTTASRPPAQLSSCPPTQKVLVVQRSGGGDDDGGRRHDVRLPQASFDALLRNKPCHSSHALHTWTTTALHAHTAQHSTAQHRAARTQNCGLRDSRHSLCLCGHRCHHHYHH